LPFVREPEMAEITMDNAERVIPPGLVVNEHDNGEGAAPELTRDGPAARLRFLVGIT
jgi:hypothetical protein